MRILSSYIFREFLSFLFYCLLAFIAIFILIDIAENMDTLIEQKVAFSTIMLYYIFYLPYIIVLVLPVSMLLTTMFSLGRLVGDNEITAMKASGISLYRILIPLYLFALVVGIFIMVFSQFVVPYTNRFREDIEKMGNDFHISLSRNREMDRQFVFLANGDRGIVYARNYSAADKKAQGVFYIETGNEADSSFQEQGKIEPHDIIRRIDADYMIYSKEGRWTLINARIRTFIRDGEVLERKRNMPAPFIIVKPSDFARIDVKPEEMNYFELRDYIRSVSEKGGDASEWHVDLYLKISFPFVSFVIVFFGAPMVAGSSKRGKAALFGIALIICFIYYSLINIFQILGRNGTIDPVIAAWFPNGLFFLVGVVMHGRASK